MRMVKNLITKMFKKNHTEDPPWKNYYSEETRNIEYTDKTAYQHLVDCVGVDLDFTALNYFGYKFSFSEFFEKIELAAKAFNFYGVKKGDIITICAPNMPEAVISFYAANKIGAVCDMIHPLSSGPEIERYLHESKSRILVLVDIAYEKIEDILPNTLIYRTIVVSPSDYMPKGLKAGYFLTRGYKVKKPRFRDFTFISWNNFLLKGRIANKVNVPHIDCHDLALILHSGGTTGKPKGIMLSNYNFNAESQQASLVIPTVKPRDKIVGILPNFHGFGLCVSIHTPLCFRVEVILIPEFDGKRFHNIMKKNKPNVLVGVPTLWEAMLNNKHFDDVDLSDLKYMISGGDSLSIATEDKVNEFLKEHNASIKITKGYGMTEAVAACAYTFEGTNEPGSIGIPMVGTDFCICDPENFSEVDYGVEGEICISGPTVMMGYLNDLAETDNVLRVHDDGKTWLHTGDLGYITEEGIIYFTQRLKRMIVSSGFNVYPVMIESVIERHPDVERCCVVSVPHPYKMHVPKAFIVLKNGAKATAKIKREIKDLCKENLAVYSVPKLFEYRSDLPQTLMKKIDYKALEKEELAKYKASCEKKKGKN